MDIASIVLPLADTVQKEDALHEGPSPFLYGGAVLLVFLLLLLIVTRFNIDR